MNSRTLALLVLSILSSGCIQITSLPSEPVDQEQTSVETVQPEQPDLPETRPTTLAPEIVLEETPESAVERTAGEKSVDETSQVPEQPVSAISEQEQLAEQSQAQIKSVAALCNEIGSKLGSVTVEDCMSQHLSFAGSYTVQSRPMVIRDFLPDDSDSKKTRIFIMGGIHGDEYSSISIMFKWMELLDKSDNRDFHWRFAPTVNPDGLLDGQAIRQNANGVDLNRNFPSNDWQDLAEHYWTNITNRNPRRFPGNGPASEPEVQWVVDQIEKFKPDVIVSVHAPYHLLDYDGPPEPPEQIGELHLHLLGVYPGSLGNYAGINLGIPVVTMELPSAGIMPSGEQIESMWQDLLAWLYEHHET